MKYKLVEIFESLQGEGRNTGRPCVFVRFAGCNLACPWCDTDVGERFSMTLDELLNEIATYKAKTVVLTGGEPTLLDGAPELVAALKKLGYYIAVETNATIDAAWLQFVDYIACSPKAEFPEKIALRKANEVRVVASNDSVIEFCKKVKDLIEADDYYVSPCDHNGEIDFATAKSVLNQLEGWSLSGQLHKILGFR